jgi:hypothetical protein
MHIEVRVPTPMRPSLLAALWLSLVMAGCASTGTDPRPAKSEWEPCERSRPAAITILCIKQ